MPEWLYSKKRRQYGRDDFIPSLAEGACPDDVFNCVQGLAITHNDCKQVDVKDADGLMKFILGSLFDGNQEPFH